MKIKKTDHTSALDILSSAAYKNYTARMCGDGKVLQIEERVGKKLIRAIDPLSKLGRQLLNTRKILFLMPDGETVRDKTIQDILLLIKENARGEMHKLPRNREWKKCIEKNLERIDEWGKLYLCD